MKRVFIGLIGLIVLVGPIRLYAQSHDSVAVISLPEGQHLELVWVEGGTFTMGSNTARGASHSYEATRPEHSVTVGGFFMGSTEVTQGVWRAVMGENPSKFSGNDSLPVEQVSWTEAQQFVTLLAQLTGHRFRLPTEAEWEFAARGGVKGRAGEPFAGCGRGQLEHYAWFTVNSDRTTHPVARLLPNALGLYDMSGNVAEWCSDWMEPYSAEAQENPRGPKVGSSRVLRGGHYNSVSAACAVFDRSWYVPTATSEYFGLRVVMVDE
ncbi:MAG: formylglycine-generating enzyme family protein [Bacteroidales bacterium]|nr:formylglycine-generating enzyme family protein [Bacteroidales bacterium]